MPSTLDKPRPTTATLKLNAIYRARLKSLATVKKRSSHYLMHEAAERCLTAEKAQQAVLKSVDDSVAHFEASEQYITQDEAKSWAK